MKCLAVDDEPLALKIISDFCSKVGFIDLAATCTSAIEAGEKLRGEPFDLIFLDINMPHLTGIDFLRTADRIPMVVFTTAYPDYALTGFELNAVDYLVKPFSFDRFLKAVNKADELMRLRTRTPFVSREREEADYIMIRVEYATVRLELRDILYIEGLKDYVKIATPAKNYVTKSSMKNVEEKLPQSRFKRVHKSYIVNLDRIRSFENNHVRIGDHRIPVGTNNREEFLEYLERNRL